MSLVWLLSSCTGAAVEDSGPAVETVTETEPDCGEFSEEAWHSPFDVSWVSGGVDLTIYGGWYGMVLGMTGPLVPGGDLHRDEGCILDEPPWGVTPEDRGCRDLSPTGIYLETAEDPLDYDPMTHTVFSAEVADEMTYVIIDNSYPACFVFGHDTCIYAAMDCHQPYGYAGD